MKRLIQFVRDWPWEYGVCFTVIESRARRHRITGSVQFVMWRAGEQGHAKDFWCDYHSYWWPTFKPAP